MIAHTKLVVVVVSAVRTECPVASINQATYSPPDRFAIIQTLIATERNPTVSFEWLISMNSLNESLGSWATALSAIVSFLGLIRSRTWLTGIGVCFMATSILALAYARKERLLVKSAAVKVQGRSLDSLNIANLRRRVNHSLVVQEAHQVATVDGEDLEMVWQYSGYCRAAREVAVEFSIDTDNNVPFEELGCFAYDLRRDPRKRHKIQPILIGDDGISKKIAVPFLEPLVAQQPFNIMLVCKLPGCMKAGIEYYTSTLSLDQKQLQRCTVRLIFVRGRPEWLRVYALDATGHTNLLKDLRPHRQERGVIEYLDVAEDIEVQPARIYVFQRDSHA